MRLVRREEPRGCKHKWHPVTRVVAQLPPASRSSSSSSGNSSFIAPSPSQGHSIMEPPLSSIRHLERRSTTVNHIAEQCLFSEAHRVDPPRASECAGSVGARLLTPSELFNSHLNIALCIGRGGSVERKTAARYLSQMDCARSAKKSERLWKSDGGKQLEPDGTDAAGEFINYEYFSAQKW